METCGMQVFTWQVAGLGPVSVTSRSAGESGETLARVLARQGVTRFTAHCATAPGYSLGR
jgi:hypothetical protein